LAGVVIIPANPQDRGAGFSPRLHRIPAPRRLKSAPLFFRSLPAVLLGAAGEFHIINFLSTMCSDMPVNGDGLAILIVLAILIAEAAFQKRQTSGRPFSIRDSRFN
jgi:hypothetical protein